METVAKTPAVRHPTRQHTLAKLSHDGSFQHPIFAEYGSLNLHWLLFRLTIGQTGTEGCGRGCSATCGDDTKFVFDALGTKDSGES